MPKFTDTAHKQKTEHSPKQDGIIWITQMVWDSELGCYDNQPRLILKTRFPPLQEPRFVIHDSRLMFKGTAIHDSRYLLSEAIRDSRLSLNGTIHDTRFLLLTIHDLRLILLLRLMFLRVTIDLRFTIHDRSTMWIVSLRTSQLTWINRKNAW